MTNNEVKVYISLGVFADFKTGLCYPNNDQIHEKSGVCKTGIPRCTQSLKSMGLIEKRRASKKFMFKNQYIILQNPVISVPVRLKKSINRKSLLNLKKAKVQSKESNKDLRLNDSNNGIRSNESNNITTINKNQTRDIQCIVDDVLIKRVKHSPQTEKYANIFTEGNKQEEQAKDRLATFCGLNTKKVIKFTPQQKAEFIPYTRVKSYGPDVGEVAFRKFMINLTKRNKPLQEIEEHKKLF